MLSRRQPAIALFALLMSIILLGGLGSWQTRAHDAAAADVYLPLVRQAGADAGSSLPTPYDIGSPTLRDLWVDPVNGNDGRDGLTRANALRTISEAWRRIPRGSTLTTTGYRIQLVAGVYAGSGFPVYWEDRHGTAAYPIILNSADGPGAARLQGHVNVYDVDYLYLLGLRISNTGDVFHCEQCSYLLIRDAHLDGGNRAAHETVKVNQSRHIYIESSNIHGAGDNPIDFVAVQHGHLLGNTVHDGGDWCAYVKGGSAYINVEANRFYNCGTGGFTAGQGTGFEFMTPPWLHYETYAIRVVNNIVHDTDGAGLGVNGGYQVLIAHNTLYRVGSRSHVFEAVFGLRSCDGDATTCAANRALGGWGGSVIGWAGEQPIPNRDVYVVNNLIINPSGYQSQWQHFAIYGPRTPTAGTNIPSPAVTDLNLRIRGNVVVNGPAGHPLGIEDGDQGCRPTNPTCNATQLRADNAINTVAAALVNPATGNFRPTNPGALPTPVAIPAFPAWASFTPAVAGPGPLTDVPVDAAGNARAGGNLVGAYAAGTTPPPTPTPAISPTPTPVAPTPGAPTPVAPTPVSPPSIRSISPRKARAGATVTVLGSRFGGATAVDFNGIAAASYRVVSGGKVTAVVPLAAANGPIRVTTPGGTATSRTGFTLVPPAPAISGFSADTARPGDVILINGSNLSGATKVIFAVGKAAAHTVVSPTQIRATVPAGAVSGRVSVVTPGGKATSSARLTVR